MRKIICIIQMVVLLVTGVFSVSAVRGAEPAWNEIWDPNMVDCVGSDGRKYTADQDYWILIYETDGSVTYRHTEGGTIQKKLRIACYDGTIHSVYCIGTGLPYFYGGDKYSQENIEIPNDYYERLPESAKQGIWLTLQFGYEDGKTSPVPGTNEDDYWVATQVLVWEYQQGIRKGVAHRQQNGQVREDIYYNMIRNRPAEQCYNWILEQMETYWTLPSFVVPSQDSKEVGETLVQYEKDGRYVLELQDENCTNAHFTLLDAKGAPIPGMQISLLDGYRYRFESTQPIEGTIRAEVHKTLPEGGKKMLFFSDGSGTTQVVACKSAVAEASQKLGTMLLSSEDYVEIGDLQIQKQAQIGSVSGYVFEVRGEEREFLQSVATDDTGVALLTGLPAGWYEVREILEEGTHWQQPPAQRVEVKDRLKTTAVFQNRLQTGALSIVKTFEGCKNSRPGIEFEVIGVYAQETVYQERVATDENGSILLPELPIGTYTVTELPGDHTRWYAPSQPVTVEVEAGRTENIQIVNVALRGQIQILKTGLGIVSVEELCGFKKPVLDVVEIEGCAFDVYAGEDICADDGTVRIPKDTWVERISCENGTYQSTELYPGVYRLEECVVKEGYAVPDYMPSLIATVLPGKTCLMDVENVLNKYAITFSKVLEGGQKCQFSQVWFGLYADESYTAPDGTSVSSGDLLCVASPDQAGTVCLSTYFPIPVYVQEIVTADGYVLDNTAYKVENGTIQDGNALVNHKIPVNPTTGEPGNRAPYLWITLTGICAFCFVAFCRKSRYNKEV